MRLDALLSAVLLDTARTQARRVELTIPKAALAIKALKLNESSTPGPQTANVNGNPVDRNGKGTLAWIIPAEFAPTQKRIRTRNQQVKTRSNRRIDSPLGPAKK